MLLIPRWHCGIVCVVLVLSWQPEDINAGKLRHRKAPGPRAGRPGQPGDRGLPGNDGRDGRQGQRGSIGLPGRPGEHGKRGNPGIDSVPGQRGDQGARGEQGFQGTLPSTCLLSQNPTTTTPVYCVIGNPGEKGRPGQPGNDGLKGDKGKPGSTGPVGKPGPNGRMGRPGYPGGGGISPYIECGGTEFMQGINVQGSNAGTKIRYGFTCCNVTTAVDDYFD